MQPLDSSRRAHGRSVLKLFASVALISICCALQVQVGMGAPAVPELHTVIVVGMKFAPETLTVRRGDKVVWVNKDFFPHTATALNQTFDSGDIESNAEWSYVAEKPGTFSYICTLHPTMKAMLIVK